MPGNLFKSYSSLLKTSLGKSMAVFLLLTAMAVAAINGWTMWSSWQYQLTKSENDARNLSFSLARHGRCFFTSRHNPF